MRPADVQTEQPVPFLDLGRMHAELREPILAGVGAIFDSGAFTNGPDVERFEAEFAAYCGSGECVGVASGLDALRLALVAAGIERGDEVLVPAQTFVASWEAVTQAGGVPAPVEISDADYCLDAAAAEDAVTERTRFVMPVHLYGQLADMDAIVELARRHGLTVVEDACQAHGARRNGRRPGADTFGAAYSFYPAKNLGALGDAGAFTTNDARVAGQMRALREHGQTAKYEHASEGYTSRLDTIHALVLRLKLEKLDEWNDQRRAAAAAYSEQLDGVGDLRLPQTAPESEPVWHLYVVRTADPSALAKHLAARGIGTGRHYPTPPHLTDAYRHLGYAGGAFPIAEALAAECLSLPIFPGMTEAEVERVVAAIRDYF